MIWGFTQMASYAIACTNFELLYCMSHFWQNDTNLINTKFICKILWNESPWKIHHAILVMEGGGLLGCWSYYLILEVKTDFAVSLWNKKNIVLLINIMQWKTIVPKHICDRNEEIVPIVNIFGNTCI